jgi:hypothetical protein
MWQQVVRKHQSRHPANSVASGGDSSSARARSLLNLPTDWFVPERNRRMGTTFRGNEARMRVALSKLLSGEASCRVRQASCMRCTVVNACACG